MLALHCFTLFLLTRFHPSLVLIYTAITLLYIITYGGTLISSADTYAHRKAAFRDISWNRKNIHFFCIGWWARYAYDSLP
jgi:hypothetical protein